MLIYLIRHTSVDVAPGTCYGRCDIGLSCDWPEELEAVKNKLPLHEIGDGNLYSSPLERCRTLADALSPRISVSDRLREMDFGDWELQLWSELPRSEIDAWLADLEHKAAPGGESLRDVYDRALAFLSELRSRDHEIAFLLTHGGVVRCMLAHALGLPLGNAARIHIDYGGVSRVRIDGEVTRVDYVNR